MTTQREIVERAIGGDREAFSALIDISGPRQYALATMILRDSDRAQDAVQEAFVAAWQGLSALRAPEAWTVWLHRLTVRACFRASRREQRRRLVELRAGTEHGRHGPLDPSGAIAERDRLERELDRLPIDQRAVIVLRFYADLPINEVASVLDIPVGTAKSRQARGLQAMRSSMEDRQAAASTRAMERTS